GGLNGVFQAPIPLDYPLQDTYWVVAHLHYVLFGGTILGAFAGFYFWFPRMSKRMYSERIARWHFGFTIVGFNVVFFTMHFLGLLGMPRRIYDYSSFGQLPLIWTLNWLASIGAFILGAGQDRKSTRLNSSHLVISYAVFCLKKKKKIIYNLLLIHTHNLFSPSRLFIIPYHILLMISQR